MAQRQETVVLLGHNFGVASQLDEVADRLAQQPLAVRHSGNRLLRLAERRQGLTGILAGVVGAAAMGVSALRRIPRLPDRLSTRRLYDQATGVDRDQANADVDLVADRLSPLVNAPDGPQGDALVRIASRRLVAWVAGGRPDDAQMSGVEAAFAQWVGISEQDDPEPHAVLHSVEAHVEAWEATTRPPTR